MRRTFVILLICALFCTNSYAERALTMRWTIDSDILGEYLSLCGMDEKTASMVSDASGFLSEHMNLTAMIGEKRGLAMASYKDTALFDVSWAVENGTVLVYSSLLKGIEIAFPSISADKLLSVLPLFRDYVIKVIGQTNPTEEHGRFWGYAYDHGSRRISCTLNQEQMVSVLKELMHQLGIDSNELVMNLMNREMTAAADMRYTSRISAVYDEDVLCGLSCTVLDYSTAVAAVSCGFSENVFHLVAGAGMKNQTYYLDINASSDPDESVVNASADLYADPYGVGFESIRSYGQTLGTSVMNIHSDVRDGASHYDLEIQLEKEGHALLSQHTSAQIEDHAANMHIAAVYPEYKETFYECDIVCSETDLSMIDTIHSGNAVISVFDLTDNTEKLAQGWRSGVVELLAKLLVLIPDILTIETK